ncbi:MAG: hypothetical protein RJB38_365 [Pseudomonadota bacterium]|jgi:hypothetical protein
MRTSIRSVSFIVFGALLFSGCAFQRISGWNQEAARSELSKQEETRLLESARLHWKNRLRREELEVALREYETIARANPEHYEAQAFLARGYYLLADAHLPDEQLEAKKSYWEIGASWGEKALATQPQFRALVQNEKKSVEDALETLDRGQIEAIYWTASNLGKWAKNSNISTALKYKTRIKKMIERVQALDPEFFHGAPDRYWGAYYAALPALFGGSLEKSESFFRKSIRAHPQYLGTQVLYADILLRKRGDRKAFRSVLNSVLAAKVDLVAELEPENRLEQAKAKRLIEKEAEIFE